ncbi:hypothetical protein ACEPAG_5026 [Sanghuangporus baumii]
MAGHRVAGLKSRDSIPHSARSAFLRPHHVPVLAVMFWAFHPQERLKLSNQYLLHIYRFLIAEVSEVSRTKTFEQLLHALDRGQQVVPEDNAKLVPEIRVLPKLLSSTYRLTEFFSDLPALWTVPEDDETSDQEPPFEKRSLFGLFARRAYLSFRKMSFLGLSNFVEDFQAWIAGETSRGYQRTIKDAIRNDSLLVKSQHDAQSSADPEPFAVFEKARANGDKQVAAENLRRFFEQRFSESTDPDFRQHAMLNLVRMHIFNGQVAAARKLLTEAITVARTSGDNIVLQQCMALLRRTEGKTRTRREPLNEIQPDMPPLEVLNDVGKLLREAQPLSDCFEKVAEGLALHAYHRDYRGSPVGQDDQWAFHAMQAILWRLAGCEKLAIVEENIVLAFSGSGDSDDIRFTTIQNRAAMFARQGNESAAFGMLLDPETWRGLDYSLNQIQYWVGEIWITMLHFATRRRQARQVNEFLKPRRPGSFTAWNDFFFMPLDKMNASSTIAGQLCRALQLRKANQGATSMDYVLKALWQSEYQGRFRQYRLAIVLLADAGLEYGMTVWSKKSVEEIMPQVISGDDLELRALACYVLARCIVACSHQASNPPDALRSAIPYLQIAEQDYLTLEIQPAVQDVLYVQALVYNTLGEQHERDAVALRHRDARMEHERLESIYVNAGDALHKSIYNQHEIQWECEPFKMAPQRFVSTNPDDWVKSDAYHNEFLIPRDDALEYALKNSVENGLPEIQVSTAQGKFLNLSARSIGAKRILEVGTLGGYSTIWLGRALPVDGKLITLEISEKHASVARENIQHAGLSDKVETKIGPAADTLETLQPDGPFDFVFIDADKPGNLAYFLQAKRLTRKGAIIVVDNVVRGGKVALEPENTEDANVNGVRKLLEHLKNDKEVDATTLALAGEKGYDGMIYSIRL